MYRRRRSHKDPIAFGFDSFLDVVANVIGIIVRLILVSWVGARSYTSTMKWLEDTGGAEPTPAAIVAEDPLQAELQRMQKELDAARMRLQDEVGQSTDSAARRRQTEAKLAEIAGLRQLMLARMGDADKELARKRADAQRAELSLDELRRRSQKLLDEIKAVEAEPSRKQVLRYHAPVSRAVHDDQVRFECRAGRVTFIDMPAFEQEILGRREEIIENLRSSWSWSDTTRPVGSFRVNFTFQREGGPLEQGLGKRGQPDRGAGFQCDFRWVVEPTREERGETAEQALAAGSEFRQMVDRLDGRLTVVTFYVYPDSFATFRRLRDYLYERGVEVAGQPQFPGSPIAFSPHGTISRGQ